MPKKYRLRDGFAFRDENKPRDQRVVADRSEVIHGKECPEFIVIEGDSNYEAAMKVPQAFERIATKEELDAEAKAEADAKKAAADARAKRSEEAAKQAEADAKEREKKAQADAKAKKDREEAEQKARDEAAAKVPKNRQTHASETK